MIDDEAVEARLREKADARMEDFERLSRGEVSAKELQRENSIFPEGWAENVVIEDYFEKVGAGT
ncbi:MAG: hypothetical protein AAF585_04425 [Verrucomicrobiota bacterium]